MREGFYRLRKRLQVGTEGLLGVRVFRALPRGWDEQADLRRYLPRWRCELVFDVGANTGQSAALFVTWFKAARVYCFEPVPSVFAELTETFKREPRVQCHQLALGASPGVGTMIVPPDSSGSVLHLSGVQAISADSAEVRIETLDSFCASENVRQINYLKIDTEGHDLEVLRGADGLLTGGHIDIVKVEAGLHQRYKCFVQIEDLKTHLESRGYFLFGLYEQTRDRPNGEPQLSRADAVFISEAVRVANRT